MKINFLAIVALLGLLLLASCKKDKDIIPLPEPPVKPAILTLKLDTNYLKLPKVDSAIVTWQTSGQQQQIKMLLRNDSLIADMNLFNEGDGEMSITLYTNKQFQEWYYACHWLFKKTVSVKKKTGLTYNGPSSFSDPAWLPRVELKDAIGHKAMVGLRPEDPYFLIIKPTDEIKSFVVAKNYWQSSGARFIAGGEWNCATNCKNADGDIVNNNFFSFIPERIGTRFWNHIEIVIIYRIDQNGGSILSLNYTL